MREGWGLGMSLAPSLKWGVSGTDWRPESQVGMQPGTTALPTRLHQAEGEATGRGLDQVTMGQNL